MAIWMRASGLETTSNRICDDSHEERRERMKRHLSYAAIAAFAILMVGTQFPTQSSNATNVTSVQAEANVDPDAIATLTKMGTYLRSLKAFQVEAVTSRDDVSDDGQLVTLNSSINLLARLPDRLRVEVNNVRQHRLYLYDGKNFTIFAERVKYYATIPAPSTVGGLTTELADKYGIELPLEDLFYWGTPQSKEKDISEATDIGPSEVGGVTCEQYAFRQSGLDWQVWIQLGDYPLPRKMVLTTLTDEARPQYSSTLTWNLAPSFDEAAFEFEPSSDVHKIPLRTDESESGGKE
jgi:hypothetical protein